MHPACAYARVSVQSELHVLDTASAHMTSLTFCLSLRLWIAAVITISVFVTMTGSVCRHEHLCSHLPHPFLCGLVHINRGLEGRRTLLFVNGDSFFEGLYGSACVWPCQMLCPSTTETHKANWLSWFSLHSLDFLFTESFLRFY